MWYPDFVVVLGLRSGLSMLGLFFAFVSYWAMERRWDDQGSAVYRAAHRLPAKDAVPNDQESIGESIDTVDSSIAEEDLPKHLQNAMPVPKLCLLGFFIWGISFLFNPSYRLAMYISFWNLFCMLLVFLIGMMFIFPYRVLTITRSERMKRITSMALVALLLLFVTFSNLDSRLDAPWYFGVFGVLCICFGYGSLHKARKMGVTWDKLGKPNEQAYGQCFGAYLVVLGIFLVWVGTNAVGLGNGKVNSSFIGIVPIYANIGSTFCYCAVFGMIIPSMMALEFAFERGSEPVKFGLDGSTWEEIAESCKIRFLRRYISLLETPFYLITGWMLYGLCSFAPWGLGFSLQALFGLLVSTAIGIVQGFRLLPSYWRGDIEAYKKWNYFYAALMVALFTCLGIGGHTPLLLSMVGAFCVVTGHHMNMSERLLGSYWLKGGGRNPHPTVYGFGQPLNALGWIFLCLAMTLPFF